MCTAIKHTKEKSKHYISLLDRKKGLYIFLSYLFSLAFFQEGISKCGSQGRRANFLVYIRENRIVLQGRERGEKQK